MYAIFGHIPLSIIVRGSAIRTAGQWPLDLVIAAWASRATRVTLPAAWLLAAGCLTIAYLCQMTLARISVPPDLNWPTWSHSLIRLCRHHIGSTRVAARWTIRLTYIAAALQLPEELTLLRDSFGRYCWSGSPRVLEVDRQQEELSYCQGTVEPVVHPWFRWPSECAELYEALGTVSELSNKLFTVILVVVVGSAAAAIAQRSAAGICAACS